MSAEAARTLLNRILDHIEETPLGERVRAVSLRVPGEVASGEARRAMDAALGAAERAGAVELVAGRGETRHLVTAVRLRDADLLYKHLRRRPAAELAGEVAAALRAGIGAQVHPETARAVEELEAGWRRAQRPFDLSPDLEEARRFLIALDAVLRRAPDDRGDLRTFSARVAMDSKLLERQVPRVMGWMAGTGRLPPDLPMDEARAALGLEKFAHPVLVAGQASVRGLAVHALTYVGISPDDIDALDAQPCAEVVLTIENFASFNRHVLEAMTGKEIVVYTGGFPSRVTLRALRKLSGTVGGDVRHWGDVDAGGLRIADHLAREAAPKLGLHLMSAEVAQAHGRPARPDASLMALGATPEIASLARFLGGDAASHLEQERLDPVPVLHGGRRRTATDVDEQGG